MTGGPLGGMSGPPLRELKGYGTFVHELCFIVIGFGRGQAVVAALPKRCYTDTRRGVEPYTETV